MFSAQVILSSQRYHRQKLKLTSSGGMSLCSPLGPCFRGQSQTQPHATMPVVQRWGTFYGKKLKQYCQGSQKHPAHIKDYPMRSRSRNLCNSCHYPLILFSRSYMQTLICGLGTSDTSTHYDVSHMKGIQIASVHRRSYKGQTNTKAWNYKT